MWLASQNVCVSLLELYDSKKCAKNDTLWLISLPNDGSGVKIDKLYGLILHISYNKQRTLFECDYFLVRVLDFKLECKFTFTLLQHFQSKKK